MFSYNKITKFISICYPTQTPCSGAVFRWSLWPVLSPSHTPLANLKYIYRENGRFLQLNHVWVWLAMNEEIRRRQPWFNLGD
jgi:hypothetical protein